MTNKEEIVKSFEHLKYLKENHSKLINKYLERAKKIYPSADLAISEYSSYGLPRIGEFGIIFYDSLYYIWGSRDRVLEWKYIEMTDKEFLLEIEKQKEEDKRKKIQELENKILELKQ